MSVVNICNQALNEAGARSTIASLEENSNEAIQCNLRYHQTLDQLLQLAHWDFTKRYTTLALLKSAPGTPENSDQAGVWSSAWPPPPWQYSYVRPTGCMLVRAVLPQPYLTTTETSGIFPYNEAALPNLSRAALFSRGIDTDSNGTSVKAIFTNQQQAIICYNDRVTDVNLFDSAFTSAFIVALASNLAFNLSGDYKLVQMLSAKANSMILAARVADANEGLTVMEHTPDWIRIRGAGLTETGGGGVYAEPYGPLFGGV